MQPLAKEEIEGWCADLTTAVARGLRPTVKVVCRSEKVGRIPAGKWKCEFGECHSVDAERKLVNLYDPNKQQQGAFVTLVEFPSQGIEYGLIEITENPTRIPIIEKPRPANTQPGDHQVQEAPQAARQVPTDRGAGTVQFNDYLAFEGIADAMRGETKKVELVKNLKVPAAIPSDWELFYPQYWTGRGADGAERWETAFTQHIIHNGIFIREEQKRALFKKDQELWQDYLKRSTVVPTTKCEWHTAFQLLFRVFTWVVMADYGAFAMDSMAYDLNEAFRKGYVAPNELLETLRSKSRKRGREGPFNHHTRGRGRGNAATTNDGPATKNEGDATPTATYARGGARGRGRGSS